MRIAHIVCTFPPYKGGMGNSAYQLCNSLAERGHEVVVITPDYESGNDKQAFVKEKFKTLRLRPFFQYGNAAFIPQIFFALNNFKIIHLHYPFFGAACFVLLKKIIAGKKIKLVVHYHMDPLSGGLKGIAFKFSQLFILPLIIRYADAAVCSSFDYLENSDAAGLFKKYRQKFSAVPFGVDLKKFKEDDEAKKEDDLGGGGKYVLFVGGLDRAHYFKGLDVLFQALAKILANNKYYLAVVGSGDLQEYYKELAEKLGISSVVKFFDKVSDKDLPAFYYQADVVVLPSINKGEAFGLVLLEAMASGKPVIASNIPGVRSVFHDGVEGLLVEPGDIDDLAEKLKIILADRKLAEKMGEAGKKIVEEKYTWEKAAEMLEKIYNSLNYK